MRKRLRSACFRHNLSPLLSDCPRFVRSSLRLYVQEAVKKSDFDPNKNDSAVFSTPDFHRGIPRIELGTSRTRSEHYATKPNPLISNCGLFKYITLTHVSLQTTIFCSRCSTRVKSVNASCVCAMRWEFEGVLRFVQSYETEKISFRTYLSTRTSKN